MDEIRAFRKGKYALAEPKTAVKELHVKVIQRHLLDDNGARVQLMEAFKRQYKTAAKTMPRAMIKTVCRIAAKRLLNKVLQLHKENAGALLKTTGTVNRLDIKRPEDFGEW